MTTNEWVAVIAILQTFAIMVAGFYVWTTGRANIDLDRRDQAVRVAILSEVKDLMKEDRHDLRESLHVVMTKLQQELGDDIDAVNLRIDGVMGKRMEPS